MSDCCETRRAAHPRKSRCPSCGIDATDVSARTLLHHIESPWRLTLAAERYFFCDDPGCDVVYFGDDDAIILKPMVRTRIAVKDADALLCHCFGVARADFAADPSVRDFVVAQTKAGLCSCETSNPSGRCCLKDFPKPGF